MLHLFDGKRDSNWCDSLKTKLHWPPLQPTRACFCFLQYQTTHTMQACSNHCVVVVGGGWRTTVPCWVCQRGWQVRWWSCLPALHLVRPVCTWNSERHVIMTLLLVWKVTCVSVLPGRALAGAGEEDPEPRAELRAAAPSSARGVTSRPDARWRKRHALWSAHRSPAPRHGETHRVQNIPAGTHSVTQYKTYLQVLTQLRAIDTGEEC